jgi:hypothetical protein
MLLLFKLTMITVVVKPKTQKQPSVPQPQTTPTLSVNKLKAPVVDEENSARK